MVSSGMRDNVSVEACINTFITFLFLYLQTDGTNDKPKDINFTDIVVDLQFHPEKDVIAAGTIEGDLFL